MVLERRTLEKALETTRPCVSNKKQRTDVVPKSTDAISLRPVDDARFERPSFRLLAIFLTRAHFSLWQQHAETD